MWLVLSYAFFVMSGYWFFVLLLLFFFFKQKTAYEVRISDWSSDVCSSDLLSRALPRRRRSPSTDPVLASPNPDRRHPGRRGRDRPGLCRLAQRKPDSETLHQRRAGTPDHGPNTRLLPHMAKPDRNHG